MKAKIKPSAIAGLIIALAALAVVGVALQFIDHKYGSMKAGWLVHACANLAINTIGVFLIFEI